MFDFNQIQALKEMIGGEEEEREIVANHYKGSALNPGAIGADDTKKEIAKPNTKIEAKIGEKYMPKEKKMKEETAEESKNPKVDSKHQIWSEEEVKELPISLEDPRPQPEFETLYRQKVGTEDVFLGLSGMDPSSNQCQEILYKIMLPKTNLKDIQIDLNERQMVLQTKEFYMAQHFQYRTDYKKAKAEFVSDQGVLKLVVPVIRDDF